MVVMNIDSFTRHEKMRSLREQLLSVEEDRATGRTGCTLEELESDLDRILREG